MNTEKVLKFLSIFMGILAFLVVVLMVFLIVDSFTIEKIGKDKVKCIDKEGAVFQDEWCDKDIYCSSLGMAAEKRCGK